MPTTNTEENLPTEVPTNETPTDGITATTAATPTPEAIAALDAVTVEWEPVISRSEPVSATAEEAVPAQAPTGNRPIKRIARLEELDDDENVPPSRPEVQQASECPSEDNGNPFLMVPKEYPPAEPSAINVDSFNIRIRRAITEDENAAGARPWKNDFEFPADMPLGRAMEIVSRRTVPLRFDADSKVSFRYEQYVPMGLESEPRSTVSCTVVPKMDGSENVLPSKLETMSLFLGDERIDKYAQNLADILKGRREIVIREVAIHENALGEEIRQRREEMLELARMNTFLGNGSDEDLAPATKTSDAVERRERKERWKKAFDKGITVLHVDTDTKIRKIHNVGNYKMLWFPIQILADLLKVDDFGNVRRLIRRVEKKLGKKLIFTNSTDVPLDNRSEKTMTEKELKAMFDRPKGFITLGGMFEVIAYVMSVRD